MASSPGAAEYIRRTPPGRWEKIGYWLFIFPVTPVLPLDTALENFGLALWERVAVGLLVFGTGAFLLFRRVSRERRGRHAKDLQRGIFDCGIRFPRSRPGSLSDLWEFGAGRVHPGSFHFQTQVGDLVVTPGGRLKVFDNAVFAEEPERNAAPKLTVPYRGWNSVFLQTDGGLLEVCAPAIGIAVLKRELAS